MPQMSHTAAAADACRHLYRIDRKSTRLNSSHSQISYAVFCLKKKKRVRLPGITRLPPETDICIRDLRRRIVPIVAGFAARLESLGIGAMPAVMRMDRCDRLAC